MTEQFTMIGGRAFAPVNIPATGQYQLMRLDKVKVYILVHPNGRQAWFRDEDINEVVARLGSQFRYTSQPLKDLQRLARAGLRPFHVDADFDPTSLAQFTTR